MIGILTFFSCYNYGAYLQAYALHKYLLEHGYDNELIDYRSKLSERNERHHLLQVDGRGQRAYFRMQWKMILFRWCQRYMRHSRRVSNAEELATLVYDTVIIGSDQVWCYTREWGGFDPVYFSRGLSARKCITYAASMGPDLYNREHPEIINSLMSNLHAVSVRDQNTYLFARVMGHPDTQLVLDPTLLYDFSDVCKEPARKPYVLFYSDGPEPAQDVIQQLLDWAHARKLDVISIGRRYAWCDDSVITPSPFQWVGYIKKAYLVVTCMYHGLLFSLSNSRPFIMFLNDARKNKCLDFLRRLALTDRVIEQDRSFADIVATEIPYERVHSWLARERQRSAQFLREHLDAS